MNKNYIIGFNLIVSNGYRICNVYRHAQSMAALKAYAGWLAQFYAESHNHEEQRQQSIALISILIETIVVLIHKQVFQAYHVFTKMR